MPGYFVPDATEMCYSFSHLIIDIAKDYNSYETYSLTSIASGDSITYVRILEDVWVDESKFVSSPVAEAPDLTTDPDIMNGLVVCQYSFGKAQEDFEDFLTYANNTPYELSYKHTILSTDCALKFNLICGGADSCLITEYYSDCGLIFFSDGGIFAKFFQPETNIEDVPEEYFNLPCGLYIWEDKLFNPLQARYKHSYLSFNNYFVPYRDYIIPDSNITWDYRWRCNNADDLTTVVMKEPLKDWEEYGIVYDGTSSSSTPETLIGFWDYDGAYCFIDGGGDYTDFYFVEGSRVGEYVYCRDARFAMTSAFTLTKKNYGSNPIYPIIYAGFNRDTYSCPTCAHNNSLFMVNMGCQQCCIQIMENKL